MELNKKTFLIILGSLLVISLAVILYLSTIEEKDREAVVLSEQEQTEMAIEQEKILYEEYQAQLAAVYSENIDNCQTMGSNHSINKCIKTIAVQSQRKDYCEKIKEEDDLKEECLSAIDYTNISWGNDPNKCSTLSDEAFIDPCFEEYFIKLNDVDKCKVVKNKDRQALCNDMVNNQIALTSNKPEACDLINNEEMRDVCRKIEFIVVLDSDKDGLPDDVEMSFGTNPFEVDTDGDGVSDYEEINKYHTSPLRR